LKIIEQHKDALINLCKKHHVKSLYVFGSALREDFNDASDVDFSVLFDRVILTDPLDYGQNYLDLIDELEKELKRRVDLVSEEGLRNRFFIKELNQTKKLFYAA
jgi:uncharacterized protein